MIALSIPQPYAALISFGMTDLYVSNTPTKVREPLVICSAKWPYKGKVHRIGRVVSNKCQMVNGEALARAEIVDIWPMREEDADRAFTAFRKGAWCWSLGSIKRINPCPIKGGRRFFEVDDKVKYRQVLPPLNSHYYFALGFRSYDEYSKSSLWQTIWKRVTEKNGTICQVCHRSGFQVNHRDYPLDVIFGWNDNELEVICRHCHEKYHEKKELS